MTSPTLPQLGKASRLASIGALNGNGFKRRDVFSIHPPADTPEGFVARSLIELTASASKKDVNFPDRVNAKLITEGLVEAVAKATARLNLGGLNRTQRLLLSQPAIYANIIEEGMAPAGASLAGAAGGVAAAAGADVKRRVNFDDTVGLVDFVARTLDRPGGFREQYASLLVASVIGLRGLSVDPTVIAAVVEAVATREIPVPSLKVEDLVVSLITLGRTTLSFDDAVNAFAVSGEVDPVRFTPAVRNRMITFLKELGIALPAGGITQANRAQFDEYFALAYHNAIRAGGGATTDPIDSIRQKGAINDWDFTVDTFDAVEEQGVVPQNILAAGALDYVYNLGERLGMFRLADALVLRWASGAFDAEPGLPSSDLYRYWKLRSERISPEERAMMYRRILARGDGKMLSGMVENEQFPDLWGALMEKATEYLRRSEENASKDRTVSRQPIFQASKQLQYNLTEHATGMAHMQISEMYHHLLEAKGVLEHAINFFSTGSRKSLWTVIERASREWFNEAPNISAIRASAVDGNRVFQWIAAFDQSNVTDEQFQGMLEASEAWIIAQAADDGVATGDSGVSDGSTADDDMKDESDDWDK